MPEIPILAAGGVSPENAFTTVEKDGAAAVALNPSQFMDPLDEHVREVLERLALPVAVAS